MNVDPITLEVVRNNIYSIAEEMRFIMMRTAHAPLIKEAGDLSCALTDAKGQIVAQGRDHPIHLGVMAETVKHLIRWLGDTPLEPGDIYFTNALTIGGNHLPDVKAVQPIFVNDRLLAFAIVLVHWPDIGGSSPGSYNPKAREIQQEGLQMPPIRLFTAAGPDRTLMELILLNVRDRQTREADIYGQRAACAVAAERVLDVANRYGGDSVAACFMQMQFESEQLMRRAVIEVPDGVYRGEDFMDYDGIEDRPIRIAVTITKRNDEMDFDFTGTDPQVEGPINTTVFVAKSAVYYATKSLLGPGIPANDGCYRPFRVSAPEGCLLNPRAGASVVGGNHETSRRVVDAIYRALAPALADRVTAAGHGSGGVVIIAGPTFVFYEAHGGGHGAGQTWDGLSGKQTTLGNIMNTPIEAMEAAFPFLIERYELRSDSAGRGKHRGGLGLRRSIRLREGKATLTTMIERTLVPPYGLFGGEPGHCTRLRLNPGTKNEVHLAGKASRTIEAGDMFQLETAGGGGYGPAQERPHELAARDRELEYVTE
jgi:N-methylhydantoinase B